MPHRNINDLHQLDLSLQEINKTTLKHIVLCGDFNCPGVDWETGSVKPNADQPHIQQKLIDISIQHGLTQVTNEPTREGNLLDLCFTTNSSLIKNTSIVHGISDHDIVVTDSYIKPHYQNLKKKRTVLLFNKANWNELKTECIKISEELKSKFEENIDIHTMWTHFKTRLESAISKFIPSKTFIQRNRNK